MYPLQLSGHKFFQIFIPVHVIYNFSKIPCTDIVFIPSTGIYYQVVPVREQQLSILPLDGFGLKMVILLFSEGKWRNFYYIEFLACLKKRFQDATWNGQMFSIYLIIFYSSHHCVIPSHDWFLTITMLLVLLKSNFEQ